MTSVAKKNALTAPVLEIPAPKLEALAGASLRIHATLSVDGALAETAAEARRLLDADVAVCRLEEPNCDPRVRTSLSTRYPSLEQVPTCDLAWLEVALHARAGAPVGSIRVAAPPGALFRSGDEPALAELARHAALAVDKARLYEAAQNASRTRDDMLALVSHDLRNPLNTISMSVALLRQDLSPRDVPLVERISRAMNRMNRMIGDLLDAALLDEGRLPVSPHRELASAIVREAIDAALPIAAARGCRVEAHVADEGTYVLADRDRLLQVFSNLLGNAIKSSPDSGVVMASVARDGDAVLFSVTDERPCVDPARVEQLFDRYRKADPASRDSAGLGLFIARGIVEAHRGRIRVESDPGGGTRFSFSIPLANYTAVQKGSVR